MALDSWDTWSYDSSTPTTATPGLSSNSDGGWQGFIQTVGKTIAGGVAQAQVVKQQGAVELQKMQLQGVANGLRYQEGQAQVQATNASNMNMVLIVGGLLLAYVVLKKVL